MDKYEEALKKAKELYDCSVDIVTLRQGLEEVFPELALDEDRRTGEDLRSFLEAIKDKNLPRYGWDKADCLKWIRWIKRKLIQQGQHEWTDDEKDKLSRIYRLIGLAADGDCAFGPIGDKEAIELQDFLKVIAKPNVWKPTKEQMAALTVAINSFCTGGPKIDYDSYVQLVKLDADLEEKVLGHVCQEEE